MVERSFLVLGTLGLLVCGLTAAQSCENNGECTDKQFCKEGNCEDICEDNFCGIQAVCEVANQRAYCSCPDGMEGDPYVKCIDPNDETCDRNEDCPSDRFCNDTQCQPACSEDTCGINATCRASSHRTVCFCEPGYAGDPFTACRELEVLLDEDEMVGESQKDDNETKDEEPMTDEFQGDDNLSEPSLEGDEVEIPNEGELETVENEPDSPVVEEVVEETVDDGKEEKVQEVCNTILSGKSGLFASKNFPDPYPENNNCTWNITVVEGKKVRITFHLLNVEGNRNCQWDYVKVYNSDGSIMKFVCGFLQQDLVLTASGNTAGVHLFADGYIQSAGFLASWQTVDGSEEPNDGEQEGTEENEDNMPGYLLSFPQTFTTSVEAQEENVCLQLFNVPNDGNINVKIFKGKDLLNGTATVETSFAHTGGNEDIHCQTLRLPEDFKSGTGIVQIEGSFEGSDYNILSFKSVRALKIKPLTLIQTDKADYRPKQVVKFRVMLMNYELKPSVVTSVHEMWITNPQNSRLEQWKNVELKKGIAQREFQLSEEPALGSWTIHAKLTENSTTKHKANFLVAENVLPKFEVNIEGPKVIYRDDKDANFTVCGVYTHGGKVNGNANVTFFSEYKEKYWRAPTLRVSINKPANELNNGCVEVSLNNTEINKIAVKGPLQVHATIEEGVTQTKHDSSSSQLVFNTPFEIDISASSTEHIIGGFPYLGKIKVRRQDGQTIPNAKLKVCARLFTSLQEMKDYVNQNSYKFYQYDEDSFLGLSDKLKTLLYKQICQDKQSGEDGTFSFSVPLIDVPQNITKLSIKFESLDQLGNNTTGMIQPVANLNVVLTHSNSTSALAIVSEETPEMSCGQNKIKVFFSSQPNVEKEVSYYISSGGALLASGINRISIGNDDASEEYIQEAEEVDILGNEKSTNTILSSYELEVLRPFIDEGKVAETIRLLLFIRNTDGSTLSTVREYKAESCASQPAISFSKEKSNPGDKVTLKIAGKKGAYCGYSVVDKSVDLQANPNKITTPRVQKLKEAITKLRIVGDRNPREKCSNANLLFQSFERLGLFIMSDSIFMDTKCDTLIDVTHLASASQEEESYDYYQENKVVAFSAGNRVQAQPQLQAQQAQPIIEEAVELDAPPPSPTQVGSFSATARPVSADVELQENKIEVRNYFPETWLFNMVELNESGESSLDIEAPHTITTWIADVVCSHEESGLSISNKTNLLVSQDFFVDLNMPYSVKRGEILPINVSVFNSVDRSLPLKLTVLESGAFKLDQSNKDVCLPANENDIETFNIKAQELHQVNITVRATITDDIQGECEAAGQAASYTDTLQKPIQVKPEGFPVEKVESIFQCRSEEEPGQDVVLKALELPENLVEGSERAYVQVSGDIMAPALSNLDKLVTLPVGCGEQNMVTMAPNVYLMDYLTGTGKKAPELEKTAKKYMQVGFDREQKFRHPNGAYSVWGPTDKVGSMWLTAFVVKVFSQASRFIEIDPTNIQQSLDYIISNQQKDGCFKKAGYVIHNNLAGTDQSITASVLITLLEIKQNKLDVRLDPEIIDLSVQCLKSNVTKDSELYTRSLTTYALTLYNDLRDEISEELNESELAPELLEHLIEQANVTRPGQLFWSDQVEPASVSRSVEITAYTVLSLVRQDKLPEALKAITWLATQRNSRGGFVSTQDTMIALQAMSQYSLKISKSDNALEIIVLESGGSKKGHDFDLVEDNELLLQREKVSALPSELNVEVKGQGCFMIQTILRYNVKESPEQKSFTLTATQIEDNLNVCGAYTGTKEKTDMVVIEIELLSGFKAVPDSLEALENELEAPVKKHEYDEETGEIVLYLDEMPKETNCWEIKLKREALVDELKPAIVKVYDYYNQEDSFSTEYNL